MGPRSRATLVALLGVAALTSLPAVADEHSFANTAEMQVRHVELALDVDFAARRLSGTVDLEVERHDAAATRLVLDTRDLVVREAWLLDAAGVLTPTPFTLGATLRTLGEPLTLAVPTGPHAPGPLGPAVARAGADGGQDRSFPVHAIAGHPRAVMDSVAGHAGTACDLHRAYPCAVRPARRHER
jgi:hypothetical protein